MHTLNQDPCIEAPAISFSVQNVVSWFPLLESGNMIQAYHGSQVAAGNQGYFSFDGDPASNGTPIYHYFSVNTCTDVFIIFFNPSYYQSHCQFVKELNFCLD